MAIENTYSISKQRASTNFGSYDSQFKYGKSKVQDQRFDFIKICLMYKKIKTDERGFFQLPYNLAEILIFGINPNTHDEISTRGKNYIGKITLDSKNANFVNANKTIDFLKSDEGKGDLEGILNQIANLNL